MKKIIKINDNEYIEEEVNSSPFTAIAYAMVLLYAIIKFWRYLI